LVATAFSPKLALAEKEHSATVLFFIFGKQAIVYKLTHLPFLLFLFYSAFLFA
jgi:hypothetical protein